MCGQENIEEAPGVILHSGQLQGPMLNCEVQAMLTSDELKKDSFLNDHQGKLRNIGILGAIITDIIAKKRLNSNRHFNRKVQKIASSRKIDNLRFGEDFGENSKNSNGEYIGKYHQRYRAAQPSTSKNWMGGRTKKRGKMT
nr:unnamed protein product [Callosobruchus analis]